MTSPIRILGTAIFLAFLASGAVGQDIAKTQDRFWLIWEKQGLSGTGCPDGAGCVYSRDFRSQLLADRVTEQLRAFFEQKQSVHEKGRLGAGAEAPQICQQHGAAAILETDPELQLLSNKLDALKGLVGVGLNLRSLKAPPGHSSLFGERLHRLFEEKFKAAGLIVVSPDEAARLPGQPKFNLFFSFTDPDSTCEYTYSVFASLSQTALLSRDLRTKLSVGVWSFSTKPSDEFPNATEFDAVLRVADAFIEDFQEANASRSSK